MDAAQYLRKSRMEDDLDTEEVLSKHRKALSEFAKSHDIHIIETYSEVVSGESLYARPEMLRLLEDIEGGKYDAVLVMDLDRLSRGRMKDQGIILDAFRDTGTLIVTPEKTYNLSDDLDDELAEFKTFMSRREYKIINKRLKRGLQQSINNGCYIANAPYGYRKITIDKKPTLEIIEAEAKFVRMMFEMYVDGFGCVTIARHINSLGAHPRRCAEFNRSTVAKILSNPVYMGKIAWNQRKHIKKGVNGSTKNISIYQPREKWTVVDGLHPDIIDRDLFEKAQEIMTGRYIPASNDGTVRSPLAGLVKCSRCGKNMQRMGMNSKNESRDIPYLLCNTLGCSASAKFEYVEAAVLDHLREVLAQLTADKPAHPVKRNDARMEEALTAVRKELTAAGNQKAKLYEFLETGTYDTATFRERMEVVKAKITSLEQREAATLRALEDARIADPSALAAKIRAVLDAYDTADPAHRNALLKSVINVIWYEKEKKSKPMDFVLDFDLKPS